MSDNTEETVKEKTITYMAGMLDAEGCVRLAKQKRKDKVFYSPRVYVSNQSWKLMNWLVKHFGGNYVLNVNNQKGEDWYIWYLQSVKSIESFLCLITPYLKIKKSQANLLLAYCRDKDMWDNSKKEECFQSLKIMKLIGSVTTETQSDYNKYWQAYLSGFFDGEGCIRINKTTKENTIGYHLGVQITNNDLSVMKICQSIYGGHLRHKQGGNCFDWILSDKKEIEKFLLYTLPYLIIKKEEAEVGLEYIRLGHKTQCPKDRDILYNKLVQLKKSKIQSELCGNT